MPTTSSSERSSRPDQDLGPHARSSRWWRAGSHAVRARRRSATRPRSATAAASGVRAACASKRSCRHALVGGELRPSRRSSRPASRRRSASVDQRQLGSCGRGSATMPSSSDVELLGHAQRRCRGRRGRVLYSSSPARPLVAVLEVQQRGRTAAYSTGYRPSAQLEPGQLEARPAGRLSSAKHRLEQRGAARSRSGASASTSFRTAGPGARTPRARVSRTRRAARGTSARPRDPRAGPAC